MASSVKLGELNMKTNIFKTLNSVTKLMDMFYSIKHVFMFSFYIESVAIEVLIFYV